MKALLAWLIDLPYRLMFAGRLRIKSGSGTIFRWSRMRPIKDNEAVFGRDSIVGCTLSFDRPGASFRCGDRCFFGKSLIVTAEGVECGDDVVMAWGVTIVDHDSHALVWNLRQRDVLDWAHGQKDWTHVKIAKVVIEDRVWIGFGAVILKGVRLGRESVIAAGAVVTKDVPPHAVVGGNPARVLRTLAEIDRN